MSFMSALDVDAQELVHTIEKAHDATVSWYCHQVGGVGPDVVDHFHRTNLMDVLVAQGWVPPTIAEEANRRVRAVIDGRAESIASALISVSDLLLPPAVRFRHEGEVVDEPLAEWEIELLNAGTQEVPA